MHRWPPELVMALAAMTAALGCDVSVPTPPPAATTAPTLPADAHAGKTEAAVRAELGQPAREFAGHYGAPSMEFVKRFTGEVKTLVFADGDGETYVSFEKRAGGWTCICSDWLARGGAF